MAESQFGVLQIPTAQANAAEGLAPYQGEFRGLVFGSETEFHIDGPMVGLFDVVMRTGDRPVPRGHGAIRGPDYADPRVAVISFVLVGKPHSDELTGLIAELTGAFRPTPDDPEGVYEMRWRTQFSTLLLRGRVVRSSLVYGPESARTGRYRFVAEFRSSDPFLYGDDIHSDIVPVFDTGGSGGGFDLATELPIDMLPPDLQRSNLFTSGTSTALPVIRFENTGSPLTFVQVHNLTTGVILRIETAVTTGQTLVANMFRYVHALRGPHIHIDDESRFGDWVVPREPFGLAPGDNIIEFTTDGDSVVCRFDWRDTWL